VTGAPPFRSVWFDCDSTLSRLEGIDELARLRPGLGAAIAELTRRAMDGALRLEAVYGERLRLIAPTRSEVEALGARYVEQLVPGAREVVAALRGLDKTVGIVSGGLRPAVLAVAGALGIEPDRVHAVDLGFDAAGGYRGFAADSPLARSGGKHALMQALPPDLRPAAFVGDGATDLETRGAVARFVGFGGVARRPAVEAGADAFVAGPSLVGVLDALLTAGERARIAAGGDP
jgi:phosphoserine phosphatase